MDQERTLAIIKPDVVRLNQQGTVLQRILDEGFRVVAMRQTSLAREDAEGFYAVHSGRSFFKRLCEFMSSGPVVILALERDNAVKHWRGVIGATDPAEAKEGTIRKQFAASLSINAVHGSDSPENGLSECAYFFAGVELRGRG